MTEEKSNKFSRRNFLATAGGATAGAVVTAAGLNLSDSEVKAKGEVKWPLPYKKLDPELARKKGHLGYYEGACCYGSFSAIIKCLREKVGHPYDKIPIDMMRYGEGGMVGWGTVCGTLNGAGAAITLVAGEENYKELVDELIGWYTEFKFPSDVSNEYAKKHEFLVDKYKTDKTLPRNACGSPLCHVSVTEWCKTSGYASGSSERSERCARTTGDVAAKVVELLNDLHDGSFTPAYSMPDQTQQCRTCHHKGENYDMGQFTRGKMNCKPCHGNPHK